MPDNERGILHFLYGVLQSATWDILKQAIGGGTVIALVAGVYQYLRHRSVDWWGLLILGVAAALLWLWVSRRKKEMNTAELETSIDSILSRKGLSPDQPKQVSHPELTQEPKVPDAIFDAEISCVARAHKTPFYEMTRQLMQVMGKKDDFSIDMDIIANMYLVNVSSERQYIRDIVASIEIDGKRVEMIQQNNFDAWEINDREYEYCLDPKPDEANFRLEERALPLSPLLTIVPAELSPRQPLQGWVRFLLRGVDPEKLENNTSYNFAIRDSLGREHPITRSGQAVVGNVTAWEKKVRK